MKAVLHVLSSKSPEELQRSFNEWMEHNPTISVMYTQVVTVGTTISIFIFYCPPR